MKHRGASFRLWRPCAFWLLGMITIIIFSVNCFSEPTPRTPGKTWLQYSTPENAGWSTKKLEDIIPDAKLVIVHRVNTFEKKRVDEQRLTLVNMILDARVSKSKALPKLKPLQVLPPKGAAQSLDRDLLTKYVGKYGCEGDITVRITMEGETLVLQDPQSGTFDLIPISATRFLAEDRLSPVSFELDSNGAPARMVIEWAPNEKQAGVYLGP